MEGPIRYNMNASALGLGRNRWGGRDLSTRIGTSAPCAGSGEGALGDVGEGSRQRLQLCRGGITQEIEKYYRFRMLIIRDSADQNKPGRVSSNEAEET